MQPHQPTKASTIVDLHGLKLAFYTPDASLRERFDLIYGHLPRAEEIRPVVRIDWQLHLSDTAPLPPPNLPAISVEDLVSYYGDANVVTIRMPKYGLITVDLRRNRLQGQVTPNCLDVYGAFEDVLMISLAPIYRRRGWHPLHAFAARAPGGRAALITGQMGSGKTTTGLALLSAGWKLLSNDSPLLTLQNGQIRVLAYPGRLSAFDDSLARFEDLKKFIPANPLARTGSIDTLPKRVFRAEEVFFDPWVSDGVAGGVFFPQVVPGLEQSQLVKIAATEAVLQLMPQAIEGWDQVMIGPTMHLLSQLVEQAPCYLLRLSPHIRQLPMLIIGGMT